MCNTYFAAAAESGLLLPWRLRAWVPLLRRVAAPRRQGEQEGGAHVLQTTGRLSHRDASLSKRSVLPRSNSSCQTCTSHDSKNTRTSQYFCTMCEWTARMCKATIKMATHNPWLPLLCNIAPPEIYRREALLKSSVRSHLLWIHPFRTISHLTERWLTKVQKSPQRIPWEATIGFPVLVEMEFLPIANWATSWNGTITVMRHEDRV